MVVNGQESSTRQIDTVNELARIDSWRLLHPEVLESGSAARKSVSTHGENSLPSPSGDTKDDDLEVGLTPCNENNRAKLSSNSASSSEDILVCPDTSSTESKDGVFDNTTHTVSKKPRPSDLPDEIDPSNAALVESPGIQVMERIDSGYNPNRIPSSVFTRSDSLNQAEWSIASNDSLFSIHVGNDASLGRDQSFNMSSKSWELGKSDNSGDLAKLSDEPSVSDHLPSISPPRIEASERKSDDESKRKSIDKLQEDSGNHKKDGYVVEKDEIRPLPIINNSISRRSDASEESTCSFAFPILAPCGPSSIHPKTENLSPRGGEQNLHAQISTGSTNPGALSTRKNRNHHSKWSRFYYCFSCRSCCSFPFFRSCPCRRFC